MAQKILYVEDNEEIKEDFEFMMGHNDFGVIPAEGYDTGLMAAKEHDTSIDIVILDINYADGNGVQLYDAIQENGYCENARYFFMTAADDASKLFEDAKERVREENIIRKPIGMGELVAILKDESKGHIPAAHDTGTNPPYPTEPNQ